MDRVPLAEPAVAATMRAVMISGRVIRELCFFEEEKESQKEVSKKKIRIESQ